MSLLGRRRAPGSDSGLPPLISLEVSALADDGRPNPDVVGDRGCEEEASALLVLEHLLTPASPTAISSRDKEKQLQETRCNSARNTKSSC